MLFSLTPVCPGCKWLSSCFKMGREPCRAPWQGRTLRSWAVKGHSVKNLFIKLRSVCTAKETMDIMKRQPTEREEVFANDLSDKGLLSNLYWDISFADTSSHSVGCLFIVSMVSFAMQKLLGLMKRLFTIRPGLGRCPREGIGYPLQCS